MKRFIALAALCIVMSRFCQSREPATKSSSNLIHRRINRFSCSHRVRKVHDGAEVGQRDIDPKNDNKHVTLSTALVKCYPPRNLSYAMGEKPIMFPIGGEMNVTEGNELKIQCYSKEAKLHFSYPENTFLIPRSEHEILRTEDRGYTFLRSNAISTDTGWYACSEASIEIDNHFKNLNHTHNDISWIYVYVLSDDIIHNRVQAFRRLLGKFYSFPKTIIVVLERSAVVPCRPAWPSGYITLWLNFQIVQLDGTVWFDPKVGFVIQKVIFEADEAIYQCIHSDNTREDYILRYSAARGPRPRMVTGGDELILQDGDELKIECYSETRLNFFFPSITPPFYASEYEISTNENGTHIFVRRSTISNDTGWYGCGGEGIANDIPYYSINYTKTDISWIYVYVNSSLPIVSGSLVYGRYHFDSAVIPCRSTSPGIHIDLRRSDNTIVELDGIVKFDPKMGFIIRYGVSTYGEVFHCTTGKPVRYTSENYTIANTPFTFPTPVMYDIDDSPNSKDLIIRMTGEDLRLACEVYLSEGMLFRVEWKFLSKVSEDRVQYNWTRTYAQTNIGLSLTGKQSLMTIRNITESDSGVYTCIGNNVRKLGTASRHVEAFDRNGGRYIKLGKQDGEIRIVGLEKDTVMWLVDLEDIPFAKIDWYDPQGVPVNASSKSDESRYITRAILKAGIPQKLFIMSNLDLIDSGVHHLYADIGNTTVLVNVTLNVQAPPTALITMTDRSFHAPGQNLNAFCNCTGSPLPNVTWSYTKCPKYPTYKDCVRVYHEIAEDQWRRQTYVHVFLNKRSFGITGILTCEACNILNCSKDDREVLVIASREPYFTSTNMNQSEITLNLETDKNKTLSLECYVSGWPLPEVTWFKNNELLKESRQFEFAVDNRELNILYFVGGEGGRYKCRAKNIYGQIENYADIAFKVMKKNAQDPLWSMFIPVAVTLLIVIVVSWVVIYKLRKKASRKKLIDAAFQDGALGRLNPDLSIVDQAELLPYDQKWEFPRELLTLGKTLGSGAFGIVKKAEAKSICRGETVTTVAVKLVRCTASLNFMTALSRELKILVYLGKHPNIVNLLGACTNNISYGELRVIVEYCRFGNLHDYLLHRRTDFIDEIHPASEKIGDPSLDAKSVGVNDHRSSCSSTAVDCEAASSATGEGCQNIDSTGTSVPNNYDVRGKDSGVVPSWGSKYQGDYADLNVEPPRTRDLVYWAWQVSRGMEYLGKRKVLHGDLAARNILLADNNIIKICDFGLSKALHDEAQYRGRGEDPLPVKWMAIEAIKNRIFSVQSDIWSFGIVMWEFFTLAKTPYPGIRPRELYEKLAEGRRLRKPEYASQTIYDMMLLCWDADPAKRPSFMNLAHNIGDLLDDGFKTYYHKLSSSYMEMKEDIPEDGRKDYLTLSPSELNATSDTPSTVRGEIELPSLPS